MKQYSAKQGVSMFNFFDRQRPQSSDEYHQVKVEILRELLRQCRHSFNLALSVTTASALIALFSVVNQVPEATIAAGGSAVASLRIVQLAKEAKEELVELLGGLAEGEE
jgi:hypothetical protein